MDSTGNWQVSSIPYTYYGSAEISSPSELNIHDADRVHIEGLKLKEYCKQIYKDFIKEENEETDSMFENLNFDFGPVNKERIMMSPYGPAVKAKNVNPSTYYAYDVKNARLMDVKDCVFNFDTNLFWRIPVAPKALKVGDIVMQNNELYFIIALVEDANCPQVIQGVNVASAKIENILPVCNMFNFNFVTKVVPLFNMFGGDAAFNAPTEDQPFGNIAPFLMLDMFKGEGGKDFNKLMETMMMFNMFGGNNPFGQMFGGNG